LNPLDIPTALSSGDRRSIGRANEVVSFVLRNEAALPDLVAALRNDNDVIRMRAADALEKISAIRSDWVTPFADDLLDAVAIWNQQEINWHVAQILPRLDLTQVQQDRAICVLFGFLAEQSRILRTFALTGLVEFSMRDPCLRDRVIPEVQSAAASGIPSLEARARKLIQRMN
jgi:HEAT repeat protein